MQYEPRMEAIPSPEEEMVLRTTTLLQVRQKDVPWHRRLWAVLKIPYDVARYVVTGNMDMIHYEFKPKGGK